MTVISAQNVVVDFPIYGGTSRSLKNKVMHTATGGLLARDASDRIVSRALDGVSFDFHDGDRIGLIGHNGSGKSTLLRLLAGIYKPTGGSVEVNGHVTSMLSITLGMDMEATGMENIYMRGNVMGIRPRQMKPLIEGIVDFSGLGDYIYLPIRTYSSGMTMRLAFAICTCVDADIILMDEWISVGDAEFADKSKARLDKLVGNARIVVLASHDHAMIKNRCNKILHLEHGKILSLSSTIQANDLIGNWFSPPIKQ